MKRIPKWIWITLAAVIGGAGITLSVLTIRLEPMLRERVKQELRDRYESDVDIQKLSISLYPRARVTADEVVFRRKGDAGDPPMIKIRRFTADATLSGLRAKPTHVEAVRLEGLEIHVHPKGERKPGGPHHTPSPFLLDKVIADGTKLVIIPKTPGKDPKVFEIEKLTLHSAGPEQPMRFVATLTNPTPPGLIESTGSFGPWDADEPSATPVSGDYTFSKADLSVFPGIQGILSSKGSYKGELQRIEVDGTTETPDFALKVSGNQVELKTDFHAIVDGTDGDTHLEPVNAHFLRTTVICRGGVVKAPGASGRDIALNVTVNNGRIQDILRLLVKGGKPPLTGSTTFQAKFDLPPGKSDVIDRLSLAGAFGVGGMQFTKPAAQEKIAGLSHRAQGHPNADDDEGPVLSNLKGRFTMKNDVCRFSELSFDMPGAGLHLAGTYGLRNEQLDFEGTIRTEAKVSQMVTGWKSVFLKAVDPFFQKDGAGGVFPVKITGERAHPEIKLNFRRKSS